MAPATTSFIDIPWSLSTVSVSIIDTSTFMGNFSPSISLGPPIPGFDRTDGGIWSFMIDHPDGRLLYDLGVPAQWETDFPPRIVDQVRGFSAVGVDLSVTRYVSDILEESGISLDTIDAIIWSHVHFDHIGRPSLFPSSTDLIVGQGTLETFGVGYPDSMHSPYLARDLVNRTVTEVPFPDDALRIGGLAAYDYFGDGSFYLLETPGHEIGQISALARVTSKPPSFIYLGGDSFTHASQLRPNKFVPLPDEVYLNTPIPSAPNPIPRHLLAKLHPSARPESLPAYASNLTSAHDTPFATVNVNDDGTSLARFPDIARDVVSKLHAFDADDRVLIVGAHDETLRGIIDQFPKKADQWLAKGWKEKSRWQFVREYEHAFSLLNQDVGL